MEKRFNFNPVSFTLEEIVESDSSGFEIKSGLYQIQIKQASLRSSRESSALAISFLFDIVREKNNDKFNMESQEISMWFVKGNGEANDFIAKKIASLLYLVGLPTQINSECFVSEDIIVKTYNAESGKYEETKQAGENFKKLVGKKVWALIGVDYQIYNDKVVKRLSFDSFYNDTFKSVSEIKAGSEAKKWSSRLSWLEGVEKASFEDANKKIGDINKDNNYATQNGGYSPYDYSATPYPPSENTAPHPTKEIDEAEIPF